MLKAATILVIDNDEPIRALISELLTDEGYSVQTAASASDAFGAFADGLPNLILCDYHLPVIDGLTFARTLKGMGIQLPIVLITADSKPPDPLEDVASCLLKPFDIADLLDCIQAYIKFA